MLNMENLFRSDRLVYRAVDTEEDAKFFHSIQSDVDAFAHSDDSILRPETMKHSKSHTEHVANNTLIGVIICLSPDVPASGTVSQDGNAGSDGKPQSAAFPTPIGGVYLKGLKPDTAHHRQSYIAMDILRAHQGKGYGTEAINWVLDWGFKQAGLHRIGIEAFSFNEGAMRLYERIGFVFEGRKRDMISFNGGWHDMVSYSMLEDEWRELRQQGKGLSVFAV